MGWSVMIVVALCIQSQYVFIHHALLETLVLGRVVYPCSQFDLDFDQLCNPIHTDDNSKLQLQYNVC